MPEDPMEIYTGVTAPVRRWIMKQRVKQAVNKVLANKSEPLIRYETGVLYDEFYGRKGTLPTKTTTAIDDFVISNEGIRMLHQLGYDLCSTCTGEGWDADWGGPHVCAKCKGIGITPLEKTSVPT